MNTVRISLEFSGVLLPVAVNEQGHEVVPLKPIVEVFGLSWPRQFEKVNHGWMARRLGTCVQPLLNAGQQRDMCCIRVDRVAAYLNSLNPDTVRIHGNEDGADFLERKQAEWDDVLHAYESQRGVFAHGQREQGKLESQKMRDLALLVNRYTDCPDAQIRKGLFQLISRCFEGLGVGGLQTDMFDTEEAS